MATGKYRKILINVTPEQKRDLDRLNEITGVPTALRLRRAVDEILDRFRKELKARKTK